MYGVVPSDMATCAFDSEGWKIKDRAFREHAQVGQFVNVIARGGRVSALTSFAARLASWHSRIVKATVTSFRRAEGAIFIKHDSGSFSDHVTKGFFFTGILIRCLMRVSPSFRAKVQGVSHDTASTNHRDNFKVPARRVASASLSRFLKTRLPTCSDRTVDSRSTTCTCRIVAPHA